MSRIQSKAKKYVNALGQNENIVSLREARGLPFHPQFIALGEIGTEWIPPMNAVILMTQIPETRASQVTQMTGAEPPRDTFRWDILDDVKVRFNCESLDLEWYARDPPNQGKCGSCWAVASAGMHGDRWRIWTQKNIPPLSPTVILSCCIKDEELGLECIGGDKCKGGTADASYEICHNVGLPSEECIPYDWCGVNCKSGDVPDCKGKGGYTQKCKDIPPPPPTNPPPPPPYFATQKGKQAQAVVGKYDVEYGGVVEEIWNSGPITTGYTVMADFYGPTDTKSQNPKLWTATNGIYMNADDIYGYKWDGSPSWNTHMGNHMVVIVGWGSTLFTNASDSGPTFNSSDGKTLYYWVIRNSWGTDWNSNNDQTTIGGERAQKPGYFYSAWAGKYNIGGKDYDVNKDIGLDHIIEGGRMRGFGGCWFWTPDTGSDKPKNVEGCEVIEPDDVVTDDECEEDGDCEDGQMCNNGRCSAPKSDECEGDGDCEDGQICENGKCEPKPKPKPKKENMWQQIWGGISEYFGGCKGACTWDSREKRGRGKGQCITGTPDFCDFISEGSGIFEASKTCPQVRNIKYDPNQRQMKTAPCTFQDGMCVLATDHVCKQKLKGRWHRNSENCTTARKMVAKTSAFKKNNPNCPMPEDLEEGSYGRDKYSKKKMSIDVDKYGVTISTKSSWILPTVISITGIFILLLFIAIVIYIIRECTKGASESGYPSTPSLQSGLTRSTLSLTTTPVPSPVSSLASSPGFSVPYTPPQYGAGLTPYL